MTFSEFDDELLNDDKSKRHQKYLDQIEYLYEKRDKPIDFVRQKYFKKEN